MSATPSKLKCDDNLYYKEENNTTEEAEMQENPVPSFR